MLVPEGETKEFLGREFLTWLWFQGETQEWCIKYTEVDRVSYGMDELLSLEPDDPTGCTHKLAGPVPVNSPEAQVALAEGKKVTTARIILVYKDREWIATCNADHFHLSSLHLLKPTTANPEDRFVELADDLEEVWEVFDRMYARFLEVRLSEQWGKNELPIMCRWAKAKGIPATDPACNP